MKDTTSTITFGTIPLPLLDKVWPGAAKLLERSIATTNGKFSVEDVRQGILRGDLVLWLAVDGDTPIAAITTRIIRYPHRDAMAMDWVGGTRMREWLGLAMSTLKQYAVDNGCLHLEGYGRKAWGRVLERHGWKPEYIAYRMELANE